jgi:predicted AAA+ superfamily ATPase
MDAYRTRLIDPFLDELMRVESVVMLVGPRAVGKTTTAIRRATSVVRLDRAAEAGAFLADPDAALRTLAEPVLLDEWQEAPGYRDLNRRIDRVARGGRCEGGRRGSRKRHSPARIRSVEG